MWDGQFNYKADSDTTAMNQKHSVKTETKDLYNLNPFTNIVNCYKNYANFTGRAPRPEYWYFAIYNIIITYLFAIVFGLIGIAVTGDDSGAELAYLSYIIIAINFIPAMAVLVRRLHDVDMSGWTAIFAFVPLANIAIVIMLLMKSVATNKYGDIPIRAK